MTLLLLLACFSVVASIKPTEWNARAAVQEQNALSKQQITANLLGGPFPTKLVLHKSEVDRPEIKFSELIFQDVTDWYTVRV
jgi:hypothetical protein